MVQAILSAERKQITFQLLTYINNQSHDKAIFTIRRKRDRYRCPNSKCKSNRTVRGV
ncbi:hypothetical protein KL86DYS2_20039 [uncultured Dysgonomonas sp.]|uniref:Uncharacterized protein n=1 Tax=uncultured Dysgonomonas sp. TaxID=206096 RepID=A0A212KF03_9BACT|nr:hypothetical protein KL86DYS2_20039 [uncultured Dysgonomonas sp.]